MAKCKSNFLESCLSYVRTRSKVDSTVFVALFNLIAFSPAKPPCHLFGFNKIMYSVECDRPG